MQCIVLGQILEGQTAIKDSIETIDTIGMCTVG